MEKEQDQLEAIQDIRQMMKQSSRFLSLSGLSGIIAGIYALVGARFAWRIVDYNASEVSGGVYSKEAYLASVKELSLISVLVLFLSVTTAILLSKRQASKRGYAFFDHSAQRLIMNMLIPLLAGGIFCIALMVNGGTLTSLIAPAMLIFYGLALVNGSKYTLNDVRYLGCLQIILGLMNCFFLEHGLLFWALGFGVLHIIYGTMMWYKYERN